MDKVVWFGAGVSAISFFGRYFIAAMPRSVSGAGVLIGAMVVLNELVDKPHKAPWSILLLAMISVAFGAAAVHQYWKRPVDTPPPALPTLPAAPSSPSGETEKPPGERVFTDRTIRQLKQLYEGRTPLQAKPFMEEYLNKWIRTEGKILRIDEGMALLDNGGDHIECRFDTRWNPKLAAFRHDESMKIIGQINPQQNGAQIYLLNCELRD